MVTVQNEMQQATEQAKVGGTVTLAFQKEAQTVSLSSLQSLSPTFLRLSHRLINLLAHIPQQIETALRYTEEY